MSPHYSREVLALLRRIVERTMLLSLLLIVLALVLLLPLGWRMVVGGSACTLAREHLLTFGAAGLIVLLGAFFLLFPFWFILRGRHKSDMGECHLLRGTVGALLLSVAALTLLLHLWSAISIISTFGGSGMVPLMWMGAVDLLLFTLTIVAKVLHYVVFTKLSLDNEQEQDGQQGKICWPDHLQTHTFQCERISRYEQRSRSTSFCSSNSRCSGCSFAE